MGCEGDAGVKAIGLGIALQCCKLAPSSFRALTKVWGRWLQSKAIQSQWNLLWGENLLRILQSPKQLELMSQRG